VSALALPGSSTALYPASGAISKLSRKHLAASDQQLKYLSADHLQ
jgi:hypothetical protein